LYANYTTICRECKDLKTLRYFNIIEIVKDEAEGGYVLLIPDLKGCLTCADKLDKGIEMLEDAKKQTSPAKVSS